MLSFSTCDKCESHFGGLDYVMLFRLKDGTWKPLSHPGEHFIVDDILEKEGISVMSQTREMIEERTGYATVSFCLDCGDRVLTYCEITQPNNYVPADKCQCGSKKLLSVCGMALSKKPILCPKCKIGKLKCGGLGMS